MKPGTIFSLALALLLAGASARADEPSPNASEKGWIANCIGKQDSARKAFNACVGVIMGGCLDPKDMPKSVKSSDKNGHAFSCAGVEEKIWDAQLNAYFADALKVLPSETKNKLRDAQRAWLAYRDARCAVESARSPFPLGEDNRAACAMEETARRALELRELAADARE